MTLVRESGSSSKRVSAHDRVCELGVDRARDLAPALQRLRLDKVIQSPVILPKLGFGMLNQGTSAFTTSAAQAPIHDATMASELTQLGCCPVSDVLNCCPELLPSEPALAQRSHQRSRLL